ncbi:DUF3800 domain-containing protein [Rhizobium anhuiense]|uniref:DUF3800 domain-containing protein n=1 Tax=Rhizobium anhuiense TaxID=1184720 RepID=UPI00144192D2|nr:DUF3800 domain-containing protein [Rhizobium anhuiense]NKM59279.1 DUF3800 domain-containing protein [Rhizobium anhuiense]
MNEASSNDDGQISKRVQMPYQAYFDESGSSDSEVYCIAGWIATSEVWKEVSIQWQAMLDEHPRLRFWHTKEAISLRGEFRDKQVWNRANRDARLAKALEIAMSNDIMGYASVIFAKDYKEVFGHLDKKFGWHFYRILAGTLISDLGKYLIEKDPAHPCEVTFDENQTHFSAMTSGWRELVNSAPIEFRHLLPSEIKFADDRDVIPLQIADLLAWDLRRSMSAELAGTTYGLPWPSYDDQRSKFVFLIHNKISLRSMLTGAQIANMNPTVLNITL